MADDAAESFRADEALTDLRVAVLFRAQGVEGVVDVDGLQTIKAVTMKKALLNCLQIRPIRICLKNRKMPSKP